MSLITMEKAKLLHEEYFERFGDMKLLDWLHSIPAIQEKSPDTTFKQILTPLAKSKENHFLVEQLKP